MTGRSFAVVIPTYNMSSFLDDLWASLVASGVVDFATEILVVDDASSDDTVAHLESIRAKDVLAAQKLRVLALKTNAGRFGARFAGAKEAQGDDILFLDTRLTLGPEFGANLEKARSEHRSIVGSVDIDTTRNVFCLYWDRSHKFMFRKHYAHAHAPIVLTPSNYDEFLKWTTVCYVPRDVVLASFEVCKDRGLLNDDTFLMKHIVETCPITVHPEVRIKWVPRENFREFVYRMWDRGPSFVEYHVFEHRGFLFKVTMASLAGAAATGLLLVFVPPVGWVVVGGATAALILSTFALTRSPSEAIRMVPVHVATVGAFGAGIVRGLGVNLAKQIMQRHQTA